MLGDRRDSRLGVTRFFCTKSFEEGDESVLFGAEFDIPLPPIWVVIIAVAVIAGAVLLVGALFKARKP